MQMECISIEWLERMNYASFVSRWNYWQCSINMAVGEVDGTNWKQNKWSPWQHATWLVDIRASDIFETVEYLGLLTGRHVSDLVLVSSHVGASRKLWGRMTSANVFLPHNKWKTDSSKRRNFFFLQIRSSFLSNFGLFINLWKPGQRCREDKQLFTAVTPITSYSNSKKIWPHTLGGTQ